MIPGFPTTVAPGEHDEFLLDYNVVRAFDNSGATVTMLAYEGYGNTFWAILVDGVVVLVVFLPEGVSKDWYIPFTGSTFDNHAVSVAPLGDWDSTDDIDVISQQEYFAEDKGNVYRVRFPAIMEVVGAYDDGDQLTNWALTGLARFATGKPVDGVPTQAKIDILLTNSGTTRTVTLQLNGVVLAQGSRTGDGTVTLAAVNNSGVSGTVDVAYAADLTVASGAYVLGRWAKSYTVSNGTVSITIQDNGRGSYQEGVIGPLAAGVNTLTITAVSDTGTTGSVFTSDPFNVAGRPEPPGALSVVAGGAWNNTQIQFTASATPGATYALYDSTLDAPIAVSVPAALHIAGSGTITWTIPNLAGAAAGLRRLIVVAVNGNAQDGLRRRLTIEYDAAGNIVLPRPNVPEFRWKQPNPITSGRTLNVEWSYNAAGQEGVATKVLLFVLAEGAAVPADGAAADAEQSLGTAVDGLYSGTLTFAVGSNAFFRILVRAATADGTQSQNSAPETEARWASNVVLPAASNVEIAVVG